MLRRELPNATQEKEKFRCCTVLGAPACGKTTMLQKMRYWAALKAYEDPDEDLPVFVALASFAAFVDTRIQAGEYCRIQCVVLGCSALY